MRVVSSPLHVVIAILYLVGTRKIHNRYTIDTQYVYMYTYTGFCVGYRGCYRGVCVCVCVHAHTYIPGIVGNNGGAVGVIGDEEMPASEVVALIFVLPTVPVINNIFLCK